MNLKLKNLVREIINSTHDYDVNISKGDLDKLMKTNGLTPSHSDYHRALDDISTSNSISTIEDAYSIRGLVNNLNIDYFDLLENDGVLTLVWNKEEYVHPINGVVKEEFLDKWTNDISKKRVVITHLNCSDGTGTAAVVEHYENIKVDRNDVIEYIYINYKAYDINELADRLKDKLVYVGDFSFLPEELLILEPVVDKMVIIDHHESVIKNGVSNYNYVHLDVTKSGALLCWDFFFKDTYVFMPFVIKLISDRDLWNFFHYDYSKALAIMIDKRGQSIIKEYMTNPSNIGDSKLMNDLIPYIEEIKKEDVKNKALAERAEKLYINGILFHGMNYTSRPSDLLNAISTMYETPSVSYFITNDSIVFSLRNAKDDISVEEIARSFGGGGHKQAAGFTVLLENFDFDGFLKRKDLHASLKD